MLSIPTVEKSEIFQSPFFKIQKDTLLLQNSSNFDYYSLLLKHNAVMVLAFNDDNNLILVKQWRHPTKQILLGCPGGSIEENEDPISAAKRELLEETGYQSDEFTLMGNSYPFPGVTMQKVYFVKASRVKKIREPCLEPAEILTHEILSLEEVRRYIFEGNPTCGLLCSALLFHSLSS
jgi:ADP-ribose pyrophosphatase